MGAASLLPVPEVLTPPILFPEALYAVIQRTGGSNTSRQGVPERSCSLSSRQKGHIAFTHMRNRACVSSGRKTTVYSRWKAVAHD